MAAFGGTCRCLAFCLVYVLVVSGCEEATVSTSPEPAPTRTYTPRAASAEPKRPAISEPDENFVRAVETLKQLRATKDRSAEQWQPKAQERFSLLLAEAESLGASAADVAELRTEFAGLLAKWVDAPRRRLIKTLPKRIEGPAGIKMVLIPPGQFMMGSKLKPEEVARKYGGDAEYYTDEGPQRRVTITQPFYMGETEVTQAQYESVTKKYPWLGEDYKRMGDTYPASYVSWHDAISFCKALSERTGASFWLPTEAQWEYACRAGSASAFHFGDDAGQLRHYAWYTGNAWDVDKKYAHKVAQKRPNAFGLYDMHGNVYEWCADWYAESYDAQDLIDPKGPGSGRYRVARGGAWDTRPRWCRSANHYGVTPGSRGSNTGFRVVVSLGPGL